MTAREWLGDLIGAMSAPTISLIAQARRARIFHPEGLVVAAAIEPIGHDPLGVQLAGPALGRFSAALWRRTERFDILGFALRICAPETSAFDERALDGDQDLLFATTRSPFTLGLAPFTTDAGDFLANKYYGASPFEMRTHLAGHAMQHVKLRLVPIDPPSDAAGSRLARLSTAMAEGRADMWLEARRTFTRIYRPIARVRLAGALPLDQGALRFDPFRSGRGVVPSGLVHAIRRNAYAASRAATRSDEKPRRRPDLHAV